MAGFLSLNEFFNGRHFGRDVLALCVKWDLRFRISHSDVVEIMAERGVSMVYTTIMRWVNHYVSEFERR